MLYTVPLLALLASVYASPANQLLADAASWSIEKASHIGTSDVHTQTQWAFIDCGQPTDAIEVKSLEVSPDPPKAGQKLTIKASGTVKSRIDEGAYADVVVKLGLIKILTRRFDVCQELRSANATLRCPMEPGDYSIVQSVDLPREIPKAKFVVQTRAFTQPPEIDMACADIQIDFLRPDPR